METVVRNVAPIFLPRTSRESVQEVSVNRTHGESSTSRWQLPSPSQQLQPKELVVSNRKDAPLAPIFLKEHPVNRRRSPPPRTKSKKNLKKQKVVIDLSSSPDKNHFDSDTEIESNEDTIEYGLSRSERLEYQAANNVWSEKYRPKSGVEMIGQDEAVSKLTSYLKDFSRKRRQIDEYDDDDFDEVANLKIGFDDWVGAECILITGDHGVGKTSLVHAVGNDLNMKIFEMNASSKRSGKILTESLHEATQSHHLRGSASPPANSITNFFKKIPPVAADDKPKHISSDTIVLLDDVEIVFDQVADSTDSSSQSQESNAASNSTSSLSNWMDEGFWRSLRSLIRESKVPIILTATQFIPDILYERLVDIDVFRLHMEWPVRYRDPIRERLIDICSNELNRGEVVWDSTEVTNSINGLIMRNKFDIRQCINELQFRGGPFTDKRDDGLEVTGHISNLHSFAAEMENRSLCDSLNVDPVLLRDEPLGLLRDHLLTEVQRKDVRLRFQKTFDNNEEEIDYWCWNNEHSQVIASVINAFRVKTMTLTSVNVCIDIIPYLHEVCKSEDTKSKMDKLDDGQEPLKKTRRQTRRRFLHYFDQCNFFLDLQDKIFLTEGVYKSFPKPEVFKGEDVDHGDILF